MEDNTQRTEIQAAKEWFDKLTPKQRDCIRRWYKFKGFEENNILSAFRPEVIEPWAKANFDFHFNETYSEREYHKIRFEAYRSEVIEKQDSPEVLQDNSVVEWKEGLRGIHPKWGEGVVRKLSDYGVHFTMDKNGSYLVGHFKPNHHSQTPISEFSITFPSLDKQQESERLSNFQKLVSDKASDFPEKLKEAREQREETKTIKMNNENTQPQERETGILNCPFCGGKPMVSSDIKNQYIIRCIPCDVRMMDDRRDKVKANWNLRQQPATPDVTNTSELIAGLKETQKIFDLLLESSMSSFSGDDLIREQYVKNAAIISDHESRPAPSISISKEGNKNI